VSAEAVRTIHGAGYAVRVWGIPNQDAQEMVRVTRSLVAAGVDGCTADFPNVVQAAAALAAS
jgi:glycerophosphoryl diester phosphodiesterase